MEGPSSDIPMIECFDLSKQFGQVTALRQVNLAVPSSVTFGLIGPNGAGKTTMIRVLLGLTRPSAGTARVLGKPIPPTSELSRIGYMPQDLAIYSDLTVRENLTLFGRLMGMSDAAIGPRVEEVLKLVELTPRLNNLVSTLSGGMKRRISLAAALIHDPELLLLDEPTVGIDPKLRATFWSFFRSLIESGKTVFITTHYMDEAARCDLVGLIYQGRILVTDSPASIRERTASPNLEDAFLSLVHASEASQR